MRRASVRSMVEQALVVVIAGRFHSFSLHFDVGVVLQDFRHHWVDVFDHSVTAVEPPKQIHLAASIAAERKQPAARFRRSIERLFTDWATVSLNHDQ